MLIMRTNTKRLCQSFFQSFFTCQKSVNCSENNLQSISIWEVTLTSRIGSDLWITEADFLTFTVVVSRDYLDKTLVLRNITVQRALNRNGVSEYVRNWPAARRCDEERAFDVWTVISTSPQTHAFYLLLFCAAAQSFFWGNDRGRLECVAVDVLCCYCDPHEVKSFLPCYVSEVSSSSPGHHWIAESDSMADHEPRRSQYWLNWTSHFSISSLGSERIASASRANHVVRFWEPFNGDRSYLGAPSSHQENDRAVQWSSLRFRQNDRLCDQKESGRNVAITVGRRDFATQHFPFRFSPTRPDGQNPRTGRALSKMPAFTWNRMKGISRGVSAHKFYRVNK
jgi:hypothetical protein